MERPLLALCDWKAEQGGGYKQQEAVQVSGKGVFGTVGLPGAMAHFRRWRAKLHSSLVTQKAMYQGCPELGSENAFNSDVLCF